MRLSATLVHLTVPTHLVKLALNGDWRNLESVGFAAACCTCTAVYCMTKSKQASHIRFQPYGLQQGIFARSVIA